MEADMKHDGMHKHGHHHGPHSFWASWCSPVGLGIFLLLGAISLTILAHALLGLAHGPERMMDDRGDWGMHQGVMKVQTVPAGPSVPAQ
ncbi:MAG: hypothetical protein V4480_02140 [Patescibacteria group bacterium]